MSLLGTIIQYWEDLTFDPFHGDTFVANGAYSIPKSRFHVPSQKLPSDFHSNTKYRHLQGYGFKDIDAKNITILLAADTVKPLNSGHHWFLEKESAIERLYKIMTVA